MKNQFVPISSMLRFDCGAAKRGVSKSAARQRASPNGQRQEAIKQQSEAGRRRTGWYGTTLPVSGYLLCSLLANSVSPEKSVAASGRLSTKASSSTTTEDAQSRIALSAEER